MRLFFLPGVPPEMHSLFDNIVLPALLDWANPEEFWVRRNLRLFGISEVQLQGVILRLPDFHQDVTVGYYPNFPETHLSLTVRGLDRAELNATLDRLTAALAQEVGEALIGSAEVTLEELVGRRLKERGLTLAVAESCTGGLIGHRLTNVAGSSDYFLGGVVSYSNEAKQDLLRVPAEVLAQKGAVSPETARAMAQRRAGDLPRRPGPGGHRHCRAQRRQPRQARGHGVYRPGHPRGGRGLALPISRQPEPDQNPDRRNRPGPAAADA